MITSDLVFDKNQSFEEKALRIFEFQRTNNTVYQRFCEALEVPKVQNIYKIPLLPIQAFKEAEVLTNTEHPGSDISQVMFQSSGTSGMDRSRHIIMDPGIYRQSIIKGMQKFYDLDEYMIWAYTPGYSDNPNSSLIWMLNALIESEGSGRSKFLELNKPIDEEELQEVKDSGKKLMLFGAAFGLLDILEKQSIQLPQDSIILETGGMKTHRREITREKLHQRLADGFGVNSAQIHSEYGMTELLSQAYAQGDLWFQSVPWMQVSIRNPEAPMEQMPYGEEGLIGVVDLANLYSCSFILTGDKGIRREDGKFQVLGRWDPQNLRGCNFLVDQD